MNCGGMKEGFLGRERMQETYLDCAEINVGYIQMNYIFYYDNNVVLFKNFRYEVERNAYFIRKRTNKRRVRTKQCIKSLITLKPSF